MRHTPTSQINPGSRINMASWIPPVVLDLAVCGNFIDNRRVIKAHPAALLAAQLDSFLQFNQQGGIAHDFNVLRYNLAGPTIWTQAAH